jgi:hypothetical protein
MGRPSKHSPEVQERAVPKTGHAPLIRPGPDTAQIAYSADCPGHPPIGPIGAGSRGDQAHGVAFARAVYGVKGRPPASLCPQPFGQGLVAAAPAAR